MKISIESTKKMELSSLDKDKHYIVFNSDSFYLYHNEELKCLTKQEDIPITLFEIEKGINPLGTHYVAECDSLDTALDFFNSGKWKQAK
jgi:hypothetical protein